MKTFMEMIQELADFNNKVVYTCEDGYKICMKEKLIKKADDNIRKIPNFCVLGGKDEFVKFDDLAEKYLNDNKAMWYLVPNSKEFLENDFMTMDETWEKVSKHDDFLLDMYDRWQDEKHYEDINDYLKAIQKYIPRAYKIIGDPFEFNIMNIEGMLKVTIKEDEYGEYDLFGTVYVRK